MDFQITSINNMGSAVLNGSDVEMYGMTDSDHMHIANDFLSQPGVLKLQTNHCKVTQNSPTGMSVLVTAGIFYAQNSSWSDVSQDTRMYRVVANGSAKSLTIDGNISGSTRVDLICGKVDNITTPDNEASNVADFVVVKGTPGAGAPTLPDNHTLLAYVTVTNGETAIETADITDYREQVSLNQYHGWSRASETWVYVSSTSIKIAGYDFSSLYTENERIRFKQSAGTYKYFKITGVSYNGTDTTLTLSGLGVYTVANETITNNWYSKSWSPNGYPAESTGTSNTDGWISISTIPTRQSTDGSDTFVLRFGADMTATLATGMRIKVTQSTTRYFIITDVGSFSGGNTDVTVFGGTDYTVADTGVTAISAIWYSGWHKPLGFPVSPEKWTVTMSDTSTRSQATPTNGTWYNLGSLTISVPIGVWHIYYKTLINATSNAAQTGASALATLSTANNTESNTDMTTNFRGGGASGTITARGTVEARDEITIASRTTLYLNGQVNLANMSSLDFVGAVIPTIVKAICAYL